MKKWIIYAIKWQLGTLVVYPCVQWLPFNNAIRVLLGNLFGAIVFYKVDQWIFTKLVKEK